MKPESYPDIFKVHFVKHIAWEIVLAYCGNYEKHMDPLCGQNSGFFNVKAGHTYSNHFALKGQE
jgi:hypothetical protein